MRFFTEISKVFSKLHYSSRRRIAGYPLEGGFLTCEKIDSLRRACQFMHSKVCGANINRLATPSTEKKFLT
jgi:hypothetical protein